MFTSHWWSSTPDLTKSLTSFAVFDSLASAEIIVLAFLNSTLHTRIFFLEYAVHHFI
jgi:hypothetical protein